MNITFIDSQIKAICPIDGLDSDGNISFRPEATDEQKAAAITLYDQLILQPDPVEKPDPALTQGQFVVALKAAGIAAPVVDAVIAAIKGTP